MSSLVLQAAQSAAQADGVKVSAPISSHPGSPGVEGMPPPQLRQSDSGGANNAGGKNNAGGGSNINSKKGPALRRGKWTAEEEAYANRLIQEFKAGLLPLTDGTTLRTFLSKLLNCDPMRISKKFVGSNCIGKQVFRRRTADLNRLTPDQIQKSRAELSELERRFLERVAQTNRVKSNTMVTTAAAAAAAAAGATGGAVNTASSLNSDSVTAAVGGGVGAGVGAFSQALGNAGAAGMLGNVAGVGGGTNTTGTTAADILANAAGGVNSSAAAAAFMAASTELLSMTGLGGSVAGGANSFLDSQGVGGTGAATTPPWLLPPEGYQQGQGADFAASHLSSNPSAAAAGRALLGSLGAATTSSNNNVNQNGGLNNANSNNAAMTTSDSVSAALGLHAGAPNDAQAAASSAFGGAGSNSASDLLAQLQRRASQQSLLRDALSGNHQASAVGGPNQSGNSNHGSSGGLSSAALAQLAQNASAVRLAGLTGSGGSALGGGGSNPSSMANLLRSGSSSDQSATVAAARGLSTASLSNAMKRKNSFDALMSLNFQSLQSIDNLANLIQTGGAQPQPSSGMKNADFGLPAPAAASNSNLSSAAQRLASAGRLGSLLSNHHLSAATSPVTSTDNIGNGFANAVAAAESSNSVGATSGTGVAGGGTGLSAASSANLNNLLRSMQDKESAASLLGGALNSAAASSSHHSNNNLTSPSAVNLADLLRHDSSTGLSALRVQDGLTQRNSSVDDFLSLMAAGDIPHQDPGLLNIPLMQQQLAAAAAAGGNSSSSSTSNQQVAAARLLAQQQLLQSNPALANALSSRSLANLQQAAAAAGGGNNTSSSKRKLEELESVLQQQHLKRSG